MGTSPKKAKVRKQTLSETVSTDAFVIKSAKRKLEMDAVAPSTTKPSAKKKKKVNSEDRSYKLGDERRKSFKKKEPTEAQQEAFLHALTDTSNTFSDENNKDCHLKTAVAYHFAKFEANLDEKIVEELTEEELKKNPLHRPIAIIETDANGSPVKAVTLTPSKTPMYRDCSDGYTVLFKNRKIERPEQVMTLDKVDFFESEVYQAVVHPTKDEKEFTATITPELCAETRKEKVKNGGKRSQLQKDVMKNPNAKSGISADKYAQAAGFPNGYVYPHLVPYDIFGEKRHNPDIIFMGTEAANIRNMFTERELRTFKNAYPEGYQFGGQVNLVKGKENSCITQIGITMQHTINVEGVFKFCPTYNMQDPIIPHITDAQYSHAIIKAIVKASKQEKNKEAKDSTPKNSTNSSTLFYRKELPKDLNGTSSPIKANKM